MILACPACRTSYLVDEQELNRPAGRTVRCASCGHTWHRPPPLEARDREPVTRSIAPRIEPGLEVPPRPGVLPVPAPPQHRRHRRVVGWSVLGAIFGLLLLAALAAIIARKEVMAMWPATARTLRSRRAVGRAVWARTRTGKDRTDAHRRRLGHRGRHHQHREHSARGAAAAGGAARSGREGETVQDHRSPSRSAGAGRNRALQDIVRPSRRSSDRGLGDVRPALNLMINGDFGLRSCRSNRGSTARPRMERSTVWSGGPGVLWTAHQKNARFHAGSAAKWL